MFRNGTFHRLSSKRQLLPGESTFHVIEDGLHECRQACREWNEVCKKLPLELYCKNSDVLRKAARVFANVTSVRQERKLNGSVTRNILRAPSSLSHFSIITNLQNLNIAMYMTTFKELVENGGIAYLTGLSTIGLLGEQNSSSRFFVELEEITNARVVYPSGSRFQLKCFT